jgi:hypothetical protein
MDIAFLQDPVKEAGLGPWLSGKSRYFMFQVKEDILCFR